MHRVIGCSVLCYSLDPVYGLPYFLLGCDIKGEWSDFGGSKKQQRESNVKTAAREMWEETCGGYLDLEGSPPGYRYVTEKEIRNRLANGEFVAEFVFRFQTKRRDGAVENTSYVTYLMRIPFQTTAVLDWSAHRNGQCKDVTSDFIEKTQLRYFSMKATAAVNVKKHFLQRLGAIHRFMEATQTRLRRHQ